MHTIEIPDENIRLYMPADLAECDSLQYIDMAELIYRYQAGQITFDDLCILGAYKLLNLKHSKKQLLIVEQQDKWGNIVQISELVKGFFDDVSGQMIIRQDYIHNPVPRFRPLWRHYYGPNESFMNVTFGEYADGLRMFMDYTETRNTNLLYLLAAIFYRKKKTFHWVKKHQADYDGDIREPYNSRTIEQRAETFKYAPMGFVYGFYLTFASFQKFLTGAVIPWGGKEIELSILFESSDDGRMEAVPGIGMDSVAFALAESGEFGNLDAVRRTNMWEVMVRLYDLRKKDLDYKLNDKSK